MTAPTPPVRIDHLVAWLRTHRGEFTEEALRRRLLEAGHPPGDVDAAFARLHADDAAAASASPPGAGSQVPPIPTGMPAPLPEAEVRRRRDAVLAFFAAMGAILGIPALLGAAGAVNLAVPVGFVALLLALVGWGVSRDGGRPGVATGLGAALILVVLTPVIAIVALFGFCLVAGGRVI
jgi:VIT1/CCC1 family predicted Fe2+/Mn2+ transporter